MARFDSKLDLIQLGRRRWWLHQALIYQSDRFGRIEIPAEFVCDLASVPRLPFAYLIAGDRARGPAVLHDYGYQTHRWARAVCDALFLEAMAVDQPDLGFEAESTPVRALMYAGVRAGGWWAWSQHEDRKQNLNPIWTALGWPEVRAA